MGTVRASQASGSASARIGKDLALSRRMKKNSKKLTLARETIRTLDEVALTTTAGGRPPLTYTACADTDGCSAFACNTSSRNIAC
jgi:hypothetical protein